MRMNLLDIWNWLNNLPESFKPPALSAIETFPITLSSGSVDVFDYLDSSFGTGNGLVYETFYSFGENKENEFASCLFLASLDKLIRERNEWHDKIDQLQMRINYLEVSKCTLEENLFSSSHRAQVAEKSKRSTL